MTNEKSALPEGFFQGKSTYYDLIDASVEDDDLDKLSEDLSAEKFKNYAGLIVYRYFKHFIDITDLKDVEDMEANYNSLAIILENYKASSRPNAYSMMEILIPSMLPLGIFISSNMEEANFEDVIIDRLFDPFRVLPQYENLPFYLKERKKAVDFFMANFFTMHNELARMFIKELRNFLAVGSNDLSILTNGNQITTGSGQSKYPEKCVSSEGVESYFTGEYLELYQYVAEKLKMLFFISNTYENSLIMDVPLKAAVKKQLVEMGYSEDNHLNVIFKKIITLREEIHIVKYLDSSFGLS